MDAAKHKSCENAAQLITDYGGIAQDVVIKIGNVTQEAFASIMERYGPSKLDSDVPWSDDGDFATTHWKHVDLGSGVLVNVCWTEFHNPRFAALASREYEEKGEV